jgi:3-isopropylmalate/(R)-2-methylmalate dehydratase small subunit
MEPFTSLHAVALPIPQPNVDTDQILPARYLQKRRVENFGEFLFRDLRYRSDGTEIQEFILNVPAYRDARIVLAEENFGCGSSREHAVWALYDYGIRVVIAPSMGDIFRANAANNGLLTVILPAATTQTLIRAALATPGLTLAVDLPTQTVALSDGGAQYPFEIDAYRKKCLLSGQDELDFTLTQLDAIQAFERGYSN